MVRAVIDDDDDDDEETGSCGDCGFNSIEQRDGVLLDIGELSDDLSLALVIDSFEVSVVELPFDCWLVWVSGVVLLGIDDKNMFCLLIFVFDGFWKFDAWNTDCVPLVTPTPGCSFV